MVSKSKKANAKAFRRSRNKRSKRSKMNKRTTRRRKGGECGDITTHGDNYHCVQAGCDPLMCAKYYKASKPHKLIVDEDDMLAAEMAKLEFKKNNARKTRRASRRASRRSRASTSTSSNLVQPLSPLTEEQRQKAVQRWHNYLDGIRSSSDSEDE